MVYAKFRVNFIELPKKILFHIFKKNSILENSFLGIIFKFWEEFRSLTIFRNRDLEKILVLCLPLLFVPDLEKYLLPILVGIGPVVMDITNFESYGLRFTEKNKKQTFHLND